MKEANHKRPRGYCIIPFICNVQNIQIQRQKSRLVVAMSWEEERMGSDYLMGMGFLEGNENVLKIVMFAQLREYTKTH